MMPFLLQKSNLFIYQSFMPTALICYWMRWNTDKEIHESHSPCRIINCLHAVMGTLAWSKWATRAFENADPTLAIITIKNGNLSASYLALCIVNCWKWNFTSLLCLLLWCAVCSDWANSSFTTLTTSSEDTCDMELRWNRTNILQRTLWKQDITSKI